MKQVPRRRNDAIGEAGRFPSVEAWYGARRAAGATAREMIGAAGMGKEIYGVLIALHTREVAGSKPAAPIPESGD